MQERLGLDDESIAELEGYIDFERYGADCMEHDGVVETEFGRLRRLEPPFPEQAQEQQLLHHMSRVFRGNMPVIPPALRIDSKRRRRLMEKRMAMGHKRDDHEEQKRLRNEQIL